MRAKSAQLSNLIKKNLVTSCYYLRKFFARALVRAVNGKPASMNGNHYLCASTVLFLEILFSRTCARGEWKTGFRVLQPLREGFDQTVFLITS